MYSADSAEDIVQETFVKIYKNAHRFTEVTGASFNSWAYKILLNTCYTYYIREKKRLAQVMIVDFAEIDIADVSQKDIYEKNEKISLVESVLIRMPKNLSHLLRLHFLEGKSQKEIAHTEHISPGTVRVRIYRVKKYFKKILSTPSKNYKNHLLAKLFWYLFLLFSSFSLCLYRTLFPTLS